MNDNSKTDDTVTVMEDGGHFLCSLDRDMILQIA